MDAGHLKESISLAELVASDGHQFRRSGTNLVCRCPFHEERTGSFTIFPDNRFKCFGCGAAGSVIDYVMLRDGLGFAEAKAKLAGKSVSMSPNGPAPRRPRPAKQSKRFGEMEIARCFAAGKRLAGNVALCGKIAGKRGWQTATVRDAALAMCLGWEDRKIAFIYPRGLKLRCRDGSNRRIRWACGEPGIWRGDLLYVKAYMRVFLTEGETDSLSLIDTGIENDGRTLVCAQPSADSFQPEWAQLFAGKEVILCLDDDEAGRRGTERTAAMLRPYARSIVPLDWKAVRA
ncbi:CHC2 zinc finger domain-containing protein [Verrucomicrobiota bacterium sgz303538]